MVAAQVVQEYNPSKPGDLLKDAPDTETMCKAKRATGAIAVECTPKGLGQRSHALIPTAWWVFYIWNANPFVLMVKGFKMPLV